MALRTGKRPPVNGEGAPFSACRRDVFSGLADAKEAQVSRFGVALPAATPAACDRQRPVTSYFCAVCMNSDATVPVAGLHGRVGVAFYSFAAEGFFS